MTRFLVPIWHSTPIDQVTLVHYKMENLPSVYAKQLKDSVNMKYLATKEMLKSRFPNLNTLATISLSIPVAPASVKRSFSQIKLIKTCLCSCLSDTSLSHAMKIVIESPDTSLDTDLEEIENIEKVEQLFLGFKTKLHSCIFLTCVEFQLCIQFYLFK